jgi:putative transposase
LQWFTAHVQQERLLSCPRVHRKGRIWQDGFHDHALRKEEAVIDAARYIVANPLRAGLVGSVKDYSHWDAIWL